MHFTFSLLVTQSTWEKREALTTTAKKILSDYEKKHPILKGELARKKRRKKTTPREDSSEEERRRGPAAASGAAASGAAATLTTSTKKHKIEAGGQGSPADSPRRPLPAPCCLMTLIPCIPTPAAAVRYLTTQPS